MPVVNGTAAPASGNINDRGYGFPGLRQAAHSGMTAGVCVCPSAQINRLSSSPRRRGPITTDAGCEWHSGPSFGQHQRSWLWFPGLRQAAHSGMTREAQHMGFIFKAAASITPPNPPPGAPARARTRGCSRSPKWRRGGGPARRSGNHNGRSACPLFQVRRGYYRHARRLPARTGGHRCPDREIRSSMLSF